MDLTELYKIYCRPDLARLLSVIRLDRVFHRASGDTMYYRDENGEEVTVTDFLGGYGSLLFGHNHPVLVDAAVRQLRENAPFGAQGSIRGKAALLGQALNRFLEKSTGKTFITTLCSTGTEAVEAAIKHAGLCHARKTDGILSELKKQTVLLKQAYRKNGLAIPPLFRDRAAAYTGMDPESDPSTLLDALICHTEQRLKAGPVFLALTRSFHGKTSGSLTLTHNERFRKPFGNIGINARFIDSDDPGSLDDVIRELTLGYAVPEPGPDKALVLREKHMVNIGALFVEPLQGEGGIRPVSARFLEQARKQSLVHGFPLVFDEIQCGMGRTGTFLFSEQCGVSADYYLLSKSLGGGLSKISAFLVDSACYEPDFGILHTSTFAEDDHSAGIALAALELIENNPSLMESALERGEQIKAGLALIQEKYPGVIKEVRGEGLMLGIELMSQETSGSNFIRSVYMGHLLGPVIAGYLFHEHRIRIAPALSSDITLRIEPSFDISGEQCEALLRAVDRLCEILYKQNFYELVRYIVGEERPLTYLPVKDYRKKQRIGTCLPDLPQVAFLGHLIEARHLTLVDESFESFSREQLERFVAKTYAHITPQVYDQRVVTSITGEKVVLNFIGLHLTPWIIERFALSGNTEPVKAIVNQGLDLAIQMGCRVAGFGGYSSIVTGNCSHVVTDAISVTSGNAFTVAMGVETLKEAAALKNIDLTQACLAGVGAAGNICSTYLHIMSETVPRLILIIRKGRSLDCLKELAGDIVSTAFERICHLAEAGGSPDSLTGVAKAIHDTAAVKTLLQNNRTMDHAGLRLLDALTRELKDRMPITFSSDLDDLKATNLIIGASNTPGPVIFPHHLNDQPVVINDIAVPSDVDATVFKEKDNVLVIKGGIVKLPCDPDFTISGIPLEPGHAFACMSETILLGLSGIREHFSYGKITTSQVETIRNIAKKHGFTWGMFKTGRSY